MSSLSNQRPPEPGFVKAWRDSVKAMIPETPRCCHTCDFYDSEGNCQYFEMRPPDDFAETVGRCEVWLEEIPF